MNNFIPYATLNLDYLTAPRRVGQWRKSAEKFSVWLGDAVDVWLDRLMADAPDASDLNQARLDLNIYGGKIDFERREPWCF